MKVFDCHVNMGWDVSNTRKNIFPSGQTHQEYLQKMKIHSIEKAIILPFPSPGGQFSVNNFWFDLENHFLMQTAMQSKGKLIPFPGVNPGDPKSVNNIRSLFVSYGIKGIKFSHQIPMKFSIDSLIGSRLIKIVEEYGLLFMMHIGTGKEKGANLIHTTLNYAIKVAKYYPDVTFILCHLGRLHKDLLQALQLDNVYMDTSAMSMMSRWSQFLAVEPLKNFSLNTPIAVIEKLVQLGFEDRLLFGSDEPYTPIQEETDVIVKANISDVAKRKILAGNILGLLGGA